MFISRSVLPRMRNVAEKVVEKIKTHVICSKFFFLENRAFYEIMLEKYGTVTQTTDDNIIRRMRTACWIRNATDIFKRQSNRTVLVRNRRHKSRQSITIYSIVLVFVSNRIAINPVKA